jgi:hypothetical protein
MVYWYEDEKKIIELAEFLVQSEEIVSTEELLEYFKHPEKYTGIWNIYEREILGTVSTFGKPQKKGLLNGLKSASVPSAISCVCEQSA